jgi:hypothetical protein
MALKQRIDRLIDHFGGGDADGGGECGCHGVGERDIRICREERPGEAADAETRPAALCDLCGRPKQVLIVRLVRTPRAML